MYAGLLQPARVGLAISLLLPGIASAQKLVTGSGTGTSPAVRVFDASGTDTSFFAYDPLFPGGVRVALGDRHPWVASEAAASSLTPQGNVPAEASKRFYVSPSSVAAMAAQGGGPTGGSQPHTNFQPYLCVDFIIPLFGIFPSPT
jgi:hypothetical protein